MCIVRTVEKAVEYILAQPDGMLTLPAINTTETLT